MDTNNNLAFTPAEDTNNPFAPVEESTNNEPAEASAPAFAPAAPQKNVKYKEAPSAFAEGLPEWSIEPPQVMVRRR